MKRPFWLLTLAVLAVLSVSVRAADNLLFTRFSDYLDALRSQTGIPGLAAVLVSSTDVAWENYFGVADAERRIAVSPNTAFQVDGLTQTFVASLLLRCDESGWISLNDRASKYDTSVTDASTTLRMLLTHTRRSVRPV
jgi:CubicO group peptidase (beta-lactamase class C family)